MRFLKLFIKFIDRLNTLIATAVSVLLPAMVVVLTYEVVARYVFRSPTLWAYDLSIFMFGYTGLLAGAYVLRTNEHVNVDIIYTRFSRRGKALADTLTGLLFFLFIILVIIYGLKPALDAFEFNQRTATEWAPPVGHFKLMIPIGAFLLLLQGVANWIRNLYLVVTGKELET